MKSLFFTTLFAFLAAAPSDAPWPEMATGRYEIKLEGMLCNACTRVIAEEALKLEEVEKAQADIDSDTLTLTIKPDRLLGLSRLRRALTRASRRANLGRRFTVQSVRRKP